MYQLISLLFISWVFRTVKVYILHLRVVCHYMRVLTMILILILTATASFCQSTDSTRHLLIESITHNNPLFIQYNYGSCHISHEQQILIEALPSDSLSVTMKRYLPVAYRLYKYNDRKKKYEAQDSVQIGDPFTFKYPKMGDRDYCTVTKEYLQEANFAVSRQRFANFINEFLYKSDNNKLVLSGTGIAGLYCNIELTNSYLKKEYSFEGWYPLDMKIKQQE